MIGFSKCDYHLIDLLLVTGLLNPFRLQIGGWKSERLKKILIF